MSQWLDWPAKGGRVFDGVEHPALFHMLDVAAVAECLIEPFSFSTPVKHAFVALAGLHDLGKFSDSFRNLLRKGEPQARGRHHWELTEALLYKEDERIAQWLGGVRDRRRKALYAAVAGHHGRPADYDVRAALDDCMKHIGQGYKPACDVLDLFASLWPDASLDSLSRDEVMSYSWWLAGFCTAADWLGSNTAWFSPQTVPIDPRDYWTKARAIARKAVEEAGVGGVSPRYDQATLFSFPLRPLQVACATLPLTKGPMLAILEDETGSGKTEAALLLAHRMACDGKGRGVFFALPTMATADAMFNRLIPIAGKMFHKPSFALAHGRAGLSEQFRKLVNGTYSPTGSDGDAQISSTEWLADNNRRALLADMGVGTIDQAFLSLLPVRFQTLRQYGLSSKILIIDEVHQVGDGYEKEELKKLLIRHRAMGGSAILLTATLPLKWRQEFLSIYDDNDDKNPAYPAITVAGGETVTDFAVDPRPKRGAVHIEWLRRSDEAIESIIQAQQQGAACIWVRNAVDDAIAAAEALRAKGVKAALLHARFALCDRKHIEQEVQARLGHDGQGRGGFVLVSTQVVESSLDLDADVMISDLAPVAALIQRAGRLWRHMDVRPVDERPVAAPVLKVLSPDPDELKDDRWLRDTLDKGAWVYSLVEMWRTAIVLRQAGAIEAPDGLRALIEAVHGDEAIETPQILLDIDNELLGKTYTERSIALQNIVNFGKGYRMAGKGADEATYPTRLGDKSRVLALAKRVEGRLVPWAQETTTIDAESLPELWTLSELSVREKRVQGMPLPDQSMAEIEAVKAEWPKWRQASVTLCPVEDDGRICETMYYKPNTGLIFISPPQRG